jgi:hypothetical protein
MDGKCTSYRTPVENDFSTELFSTDYRGTDSRTQNAKTDLISNNPDIEFEPWMYYLIERFAEEFELEAETVADALSDKFINDLKAEFDDLKELIGDDDDDEEE